jgi:hypothetical protein
VDRERLMLARMDCTGGGREPTADRLVRPDRAETDKIELGLRGYAYRPPYRDRRDRRAVPDGWITGSAVDLVVPAQSRETPFRETAPIIFFLPYWRNVTPASASFPSALPVASCLSCRW